MLIFKRPSFPLFHVNYSNFIFVYFLLKNVETCDVKILNAFRRNFPGIFLQTWYVHVWYQCPIFILVWCDKRHCWKFVKVLIVYMAQFYFVIFLIKWISTLSVSKFFYVPLFFLSNAILVSVINVWVSALGLTSSLTSFQSYNDYKLHFNHALVRLNPVYIYSDIAVHVYLTIEVVIYLLDPTKSWETWSRLFERNSLIRALNTNKIPVCLVEKKLLLSCIPHDFIIAMLNWFWDLIWFFTKSRDSV